MKKTKDIVEKRHGYLYIDGEYYEQKRMGDHHVAFVHIDKEKVEERLKLISSIATKLKDSLDREKVLAEALSKIDYEELERLNGMLNNPAKKYKPKTRENHCVDMKIGNFILPIVD